MAFVLGQLSQGDIRLGDTIHFKFTTTNATGVPATLGGTPVISAYSADGTVEITAGITLTVDFDARTGLNHVTVVASGANGYATATNYILVITTGTVTDSVVGYVIGSFSIENRSAVMPTVAARTLDVAATGEAGVDFSNINGTLDAAEIGTGAITAAKFAAGAIDAAAIATAAIDADAIATDAITSAKLAAGAITATKFAAGAIDAAAIATGAVDADAIAADAANEIADALLDRNMGTGTDSGSASVRTVRQALRFLRNKWTVVTGTLTVYKENDSTPAWTSVLTNDTNAKPVVSSDPPDA